MSAAATVTQHFKPRSATPDHPLHRYILGKLQLTDGSSVKNNYCLKVVFFHAHSAPATLTGKAMRCPWFLRLSSVAMNRHTQPSLFLMAASCLPRRITILPVGGL